MATLQEALATAGDSDCRHIVSLSGGKDSSALAIYLLENYPQLPVEYVFCDTGAELPETYDYLDRLESLLGKPIKRLNALSLLKIREKPGRIPFDVWLNEVYGGYLPNPRTRWCTRVLKIQPFEQYVGNDKAFSYIGIRGDEDREGYKSRKPPVLSDRPGIVPVYPFKDDAISLSDVNRILEESGLGLPDYYKWRSRSGCYFCFYQQLGEWQGLKRNHPEYFERAKTYERVRGPKKYTWVDGRSLAEVEQLVKEYPVSEPDEASSCAICHT
jgi:3'-phosphoadenosine 5'-phosphosulfate sulfotransferase (PAPS reductase)/FAD synthetase